jgi:hypothetical protein
MTETMCLLSEAELLETNGGEVTTKTGFAYDVANWVGTAVAFYAGMIDGFFGG